MDSVRGAVGAESCRMKPEKEDEDCAWIDFGQIAGIGEENH